MVEMKQRGFTMLELMVVVALIGILAAIALPALMSTKRKAANQSEINDFFSELRVREDAYYGEYGVYLATGVNESDTYPSAPSTTGQPLDASTMPDTWKTLKVRLPDTQEVHCAYVVVAANAGITAVGAKATLLGFAAPAKNWYYILGRCDADGSSSTDAYFLESSESAEKLSIDEDK